MAWRAAPGAGSTTSGLTSGRQSSPITSPSSPGSSQADLSLRADAPRQTDLPPDRSSLGALTPSDPIPTLATSDQPQSIPKNANQLLDPTRFLSTKQLFM